MACLKSEEKYTQAAMCLILRGSVCKDRRRDSEVRRRDFMQLSKDSSNEHHKEAVIGREAQGPQSFSLGMLTWAHFVSSPPSLGFPGSSDVKSLLTMQETRVQS